MTLSSDSVAASAIQSPLPGNVIQFMKCLMAVG